MLNKLHSDISHMNEVVIDLKQEKRRLSENLDSSKNETLEKISDLAEIENQKISLEKELNNLLIEITAKEKSLELLKFYNTKYLSESLNHIFGVSFTSPILDEIKRLRFKANMARDLKEFKIWKQKHPTSERKTFLSKILNKESSTSPLDQKNKFDTLPESWLNAYVEKWAIDGNDDRTFYREQREDLEAAFRNHISSDIKEKNGLSHFKKHIYSRLNKFKSVLSKKDQERLQKAVNEYISMHSKNLDGPIDFFISKELSDDTIIKNGGEVSERLDTLEKITLQFARKVSDSLQ